MNAATEQIPFNKIKCLGQTLVLGGKRGTIDKFVFANGSCEHITIMLGSNPLDVHITNEITDAHTRIDFAKVLTDMGDMFAKSATVSTTYEIKDNFSMLPVTALTMPLFEAEIKKKELWLYLNPFSIVHTQLSKLDKMNYTLAFGFSGEHIITCNQNISLLVDMKELEKQFLIYSLTHKPESWIIP